MGDTFAVLNPGKNVDKALSHRLSFGKKGKVATGISGMIEPYTYIVGKLEDGGRQVFLQANSVIMDASVPLKESGKDFDHERLPWRPTVVQETA